MKTPWMRDCCANESLEVSVPASTASQSSSRYPVRLCSASDAPYAPSTFSRIPVLRPCSRVERETLFLQRKDLMSSFHPAVAEWFSAAYPAPTKAQEMGWPPIARGEWTLIFAPTGSGKTLAAFLWALERLMFTPPPPKERRCRVLYISPLKALAVDVERNLRAPLTGIANLTTDLNIPTVAIRTGDTPSAERSRFQRDPTDILITTPESIYLMLTSNVREMLRGVDTIIIDEIHALVPNKRGAHLALSLERLSRLTEKPPQRIGLSATQRPLEEVARFLGGNHPVTIVDTGEKKKLSLRVEVPVEEMAKIGETKR